MASSTPASGRSDARDKQADPGRLPMLCVSLASVPIRRVDRRHRARYFLSACLLLTLLFTISFAVATPPHYKSFVREQRIDYLPHEEELLRILRVRDSVVPPVESGPARASRIQERG